MASGSKRMLKPVLKNSRFRKHSESDEKKTSKALQFNEENIGATFHPKDKDYGLMKIPEIKTPFPRFEAPINAGLLRERLIQAMYSKKTCSIIDVPSDEDINNLGDQVLQSSSSSVEPESFEEKRRKFYASEYTLAQQRPLSSVMHPRADRLKNVSMYGSENTEMMEASLHRFSVTSGRKEPRRFSTASRK